MEIMHGDVREEIKKIKSNSIDCIVTSPPYWRLRDYGDNRQLGLEEAQLEFIRNTKALYKEKGIDLEVLEYGIKEFELDRAN